MYCLVTLRGFEHYTSHEPGDDRERWGGGGGGGGREERLVINTNGRGGKVSDHT